MLFLGVKKSMTALRIIELVPPSTRDGNFEPQNRSAA